MNDSDPRNFQGEPLDVEDFDLDDMDDESLSDNSWKESDSASAATTGDPGGKTFVQKYFYFIVAAVVAIFGALLAFGMMGSSSPETSMPEQTAATAMPPAPDDQSLSAQQQPDGLAGSDMPPMPATINAVPEETPPPKDVPADTQPLTAETDAILTPMPEETVSDVETGNTVPVEAQVSDLPLASSGEDARPLLSAEDSPPASPELKTDETGEDAVSQEQAAAAMPEEVREPDTTQAPVSAGSLNPIDADAIQDRVDQKIAVLENRIEVTDEKIDRLASSLESLEKRIGDLAEERKSAAASRPKEANPAPAPGKSKEKAPVPAVKKTSGTSGTTWVLRAAQPGKAVVAAQGSNELITLEVGSKLEGIGRISAITMQDGRWIVQGSEGTIRQ